MTEFRRVLFRSGVLGDQDSAGQDSFAGGLLDYPQYTRPPLYRGLRVPAVLLSGDHEQIRRWRRKGALQRTLRRRPDLLDRAALSVEDQGLLSEIRAKEDGEMSNTRRGHEYR